jgi:methionyl-tRNA synthetase
MPETAERMWKRLGLRALTEEATGNADIFRWEWSPEYEVRVSKGERQLFPRIEKERGNPAEKAKNTEQKKVEPKMTEQGIKELIGIEDFAKVELRIGRVMSAERVEKSDKLIKLKVDIGEERQIVAGIGKSYSPEGLVGKKIVVVSNLKPAKLMGTESQGMLLAATDEDGTCSVLMPEREVKEGSRVK